MQSPSALFSKGISEFSAVPDYSEWLKKSKQPGIFSHLSQNNKSDIFSGFAQWKYTLEVISNA